MLNYFKTVDGRITRLSAPEDGCWVSAVAPDPQEVAYLVEELGLDSGFVRSALDEEESSRIEAEEDQTLVIVDVPVVDDSVTDSQEEKTILYTTMPIGIILAEKFVVTICQKEFAVIEQMENGAVKNLQTAQKTRFLLTILLRVASRFLLYLKQIDRISSSTEKQLHQSMRNKELIQLLGLEKSLVYFSTSLKSDEITMEKILRGRIIKLYDEDQDILEDVLIEIKQAIEMCNIYSGILSGTMDAFASIISNNLNIVMKILTSITILMAIPTMVSSFYGMNVEGLPFPVFWMPILLSVVLTILVAIALVKKGMFS
ncbi:magnesium transporter CorA family protein [Merdimmobilis hominis]|uniref:magnesium transporter CorA family protein n=1 Tax=Merdimmobilis hominis TaxID=2897707 RepID=UPI0006C7B27E|nr:magnesium transporter CorA family protein [Merdimmobilis hominis]PWL59919.1 MAG: magnesium transporter CorA family protein [Oscillospiraceae bacterium]